MGAVGNDATQAMLVLVVPNSGVPITYVPQSPTTALAPPAWSPQKPMLAGAGPTGAILLLRGRSILS